jgi:hypothetical protein
MDTADLDAFAYVDEAGSLADVDSLDRAETEVDDETDSDGVPGPAIPRQTGVLEVADGLTERERQVLAFERQWWRRAGAKEQAIRDLFGISSTRYYQLLNGLLDSEPALAYDPVLVKRLRRLRASRVRTRRPRA